MRLLLGGLVLAVLFFAAALWQRRWTAQARAERLQALGVASAVAGMPPDGWSRVIVGRPGGGERYPTRVPAAAPRPVDPVPAGSGSPEVRGATTPAGAAANAWIVQPGQSLSRICQERYGSARLELVGAVARHNDLESPDLVREGQRLDLPPLEQLLQKR